MRRIFAAATLSVLLLAAGPVRAQTPPPDVMAAARELVGAMKATDQLKTVLPLLIHQLKPVIVQNRPAVEKDFDTITPALLAATIARLTEFSELTALIYARNFSASELRDMTMFYRTPTGQKLLEKLPSVMQESMTAGQQFAQVIATDLQQRIVDELRKRGHNI
jgi:uncharacterized protein